MWLYLCLYNHFCDLKVLAIFVSWIAILDPDSILLWFQIWALQLLYKMHTSENAIGNLLYIVKLKCKIIMKMYLHQWNLQSSLNRCEQCIYSLEKKKRLMSIKYYVEVKKSKAFPLYFFNKKFMFMHTQ